MKNEKRMAEGRALLCQYRKNNKGKGSTAHIGPNGLIDILNDGEIEGVKNWAAVTKASAPLNDKELTECIKIMKSHSHYKFGEILEKLHELNSDDLTVLELTKKFYKSKKNIE